MKLGRCKQDKESAQATKGTYTNVRDQGVRKLDTVLRCIYAICGS